MPVNKLYPDGNTSFIWTTCEYTVCNIQYVHVCMCEVHTVLTRKLRVNCIKHYTVYCMVEMFNTELRIVSGTEYEI